MFSSLFNYRFGFISIILTLVSLDFKSQVMRTHCLCLPIHHLSWCKPHTVELLGSVGALLRSQNTQHLHHYSHTSHSTNMRVSGVSWETREPRQRENMKTPVRWQCYSPTHRVAHRYVSYWCDSVNHWWCFNGYYSHAEAETCLLRQIVSRRCHNQSIAPYWHRVNGESSVLRSIDPPIWKICAF